MESEQAHEYGVPMDCSTNMVGGPTWLSMMAASGVNLDGRDGNHPATDFMLASIFKYANETTTRVPLFDFHDTDTADPRSSQRARPAVGAHYSVRTRAVSQRRHNHHQPPPPRHCTTTAAVH